MRRLIGICRSCRDKRLSDPREGLALGENENRRNYSSREEERRESVRRRTLSGARRCVCHHGSFGTGKKMAAISEEHLPQRPFTAGAATSATPTTGSLSQGPSGGAGANPLSRKLRKVLDTRLEADKVSQVDWSPPSSSYPSTFLQNSV